MNRDNMQKLSSDKLGFVTILFLTSFFISTNNVYAQTDSVAANTEFSRNTLFLELLGNAGLYSINYEHRIFEQWGLRVGFSRVNFALDVETGPVTLAPLMINHIRGKGNNHLEVGAGVLLSSSQDTQGITATVGYRFQPQQGGFHFHVGFTPIISDEFLPFGGVGIGVSF